MTARLPVRPRYAVPLAGGRVLQLGERPLVMGILNVTPDSFAEGARLVVDGVTQTDRAVEAALAMEAAGADLIDLGGESTRPGAEPVPVEDELSRVVPVLRALAPKVRVPVSIDTYKAQVAKAALAEGASLVNDVSGLLYDPALADEVVRGGAALVLMHMRGRSRAMYDQAQYGDLAGEVSAELRHRMEVAIAAGVPRECLIVDPGIGFAKRAEHSYGVLARLSEIQAALDRPVLAGPSRKSFLSAAVGDRPAPERDWATAAAVTAAVLEGAHIVRVHRVPEMVQVVKVAEAIRNQNLEPRTEN